MSRRSSKNNKGKQRARQPSPNFSDEMDIDGESDLLRDEEDDIDAQKKRGVSIKFPLHVCDVLTVSFRHSAILLMV